MKCKFLHITQHASLLSFILRTSVKLREPMISLNIFLCVELISHWICISKTYFLHYHDLHW